MSIHFFSEGFLSTVSFLTIFPLKRERKLPETPIFFPLVGFLLGVITFLICRLLLTFTPISVACILSLLFYTVITGGIHLDGLADTFDMLASGNKEKDKLIKIMEDPHIGTFGVISIFFVLALKVILLSNLPSTSLSRALVIFPPTSRWAMVLAISVSKPAKESGLGERFIKGARFKDLLFATFIILFLAFGVLRNIFALFVISVVGVLTLMFTKFVSKKLNGVTGDVFGAVNEIAEVFTLLIISFLALLY